MAADVKKNRIGRMKGVPNKLSTEQRARLLLHGEAPLEVLLFWMRRYHGVAKARAVKFDDALAEAERTNKAIDCKWKEEDVERIAEKAVDCATRAANFLHPRLSAIDTSAKLDVAKLTPEEIAIVGPILDKCMVRPTEAIAAIGSGEGSQAIPATKH